MKGAPPADRSVTLYRQDEPLRAVATLSLRTDGTIRLHSFDTASAFWGGGDYEFWIELAPPAQAKLCAVLLAELTPRERTEFDARHIVAVPDLAFALLEEKYRDEMGAVADLTELCKREAIPHKFDSAVRYG